MRKEFDRSRRDALKLFAAIAISACTHSMVSSPEDSASNEPNKKPTEDPYSRDRLFAEAALRGDTKKMGQLVSPDKVNLYAQGGGMEQTLAQEVTLYQGCGAKLTQDLPIVRSNPQNNNYTADFQLDKTCNVNVLGVPYSFRTITVVMEKVSQGGKDKYYPLYIR